MKQIILLLLLFISVNTFAQSGPPYFYIGIPEGVNATYGEYTADSCMRVPAIRAQMVWDPDSCGRIWVDINIDSGLYYNDCLHSLRLLSTKDTVGLLGHYVPIVDSGILYVTPTMLKDTAAALRALINSDTPSLQIVLTKGDTTDIPLYYTNGMGDTIARWESGDFTVGNSLFTSTYSTMDDGLVGVFSYITNASATLEGSGVFTSSPSLVLSNLSGTDAGALYAPTLTSNRAWRMPDSSGVVALLSDIATPNLQQVTDVGYTTHDSMILNHTNGNSFVDIDTTGPYSVSITPYNIKISGSASITATGTNSAWNVSDASGNTASLGYNGGNMKLGFVKNGFLSSIYVYSLSAARNDTIPNKSGTFAMTSDLTGGTVTSITAGSGLTGGTITTSGTIAMPNVGTSGTYGGASSIPVITTDAQGRVTSVSTVTPTAPSTQTVTLTGDVTGSASGNPLSIATTLKNTGTAGTYGSSTLVPVITTDAQGRVSGVTTATMTAGTVTSVSATSPGGTITHTVTSATATPNIADDIDLTHANNWTGTITEQKNGIAAVSTDGVVISNTTAATSLVKFQQSPNVHFIGQGWNTSLATSQQTDFLINAVPSYSSVSGVVNSINFQSQIAGGGYATPMNIVQSSSTSYVAIPTLWVNTINGASNSSTANYLTIQGTPTNAGGIYYTILSKPASTYTNTTNSVYGLAFGPTYNQASGSGANYDFIVARTETAINTGVQRLATFGIQSGATYTEKFGVDNKGNVITVGSVTCTTPATSSATSPVVNNSGSLQAVTNGVVDIKSNTTATGNTTIAIPAGSMLESIVILPTNNETIKIGTTSGGTDILASTAYTAGSNNGIAYGAKYFTGATTLFIQGAAGSVNYIIYYH